MDRLACKAGINLNNSLMGFTSTSLRFPRNGGYRKMRLDLVKVN